MSRKKSRRILDLLVNTYSAFCNKLENQVHISPNSNTDPTLGKKIKFLRKWEIDLTIDLPTTYFYALPLDGKPINKKEINQTLEWVEKQLNSLGAVPNTSAQKFRKTKKDQSNNGKKGKRGPDKAKLDRAKELLRGYKHKKVSAGKVRQYLEDTGLNCSRSWVYKHFAEIVSAITR